MVGRPEEQATKDAPAAIVTRPKILLLDDEERILKSLNAIFRFKYQVFMTTEGIDALEILKQERPNLVISDQRMPRMSGVDFLRQAKAVSPNTVRILLTGYSDLASIIGSINDGEVYRFLNKPWGNQEIQAVVGDAIAIGVELAKTPAPEAKMDMPIVAAVESDEAVLIIGSDEDETRRLIASVRGTAKCYAAKNLGEALKLLNTHHIAIIIADLKPADSESVVLLKLLKQEHPQILTIALGDFADSAKVVELINRAKVYRYMIKPFKPNMLEHYVQSALAQYRAYQAKPALLSQQKSESPTEDRQSARAQSILRHLQGLRGFFSRKSDSRFPVS